MSDDLRLNTKGQCPECKIKPLVYKREPHLFCHRCCRAFHPTEHTQMENWAWKIREGKFEKVYGS